MRAGHWPPEGSFSLVPCGPGQVSSLSSDFDSFRHVSDEARWSQRSPLTCVWDMWRPKSVCLGPLPSSPLW